MPLNHKDTETQRHRKGENSKSSLNPRVSMSPCPDVVVLGIDPGLATTGWGIVRQVKSDYEMIAFGAIETSSAMQLPDRLLFLHLELKRIIAEHHPQAVAMEELFFTKYAKSISGTAQARGAIVLTCIAEKLTISEYNPRSVKMAMTGFGSAQKPQMQSMVQRFFKLKEIPKPDDAADALAIALCHFHTLSNMIVSKEIAPGLQKALAALGVTV